jgi:hypothetical protein
MRSARDVAVGGLEFTDESSELEVNGKAAFATGLLEILARQRSGRSDRADAGSGTVEQGGA